MKKKTLLQKQIIHFFFYISLHLICTKIIPFPCYFYLSFIFLLPFHKAYLNYNLYIGFGLGFFLDMLYNSPGIYMFVNVFTVYLQYFFIKYFFNTYLLKNLSIDYISIRHIHYLGYLFFLLPLVSTHIAIVYFLEHSSLKYLLYQTTYIIRDIFFSIIFIVFTQYFFHQNQHSKN